MVSGMDESSRPRRPNIGRQHAATAQPACGVSFGLRCDRLEDRTVPSTFTVTNLHDAGPGSLRAAVAAADATSGATIAFAPGLHGAIGLTTGELDLTSSVTINSST